MCVFVCVCVCVCFYKCSPNPKTKSRVLISKIVFGIGSKYLPYSTWILIHIFMSENQKIIHYLMSDEKNKIKSLLDIYFTFVF